MLGLAALWFVATSLTATHQPHGHRGPATCAKVRQIDGLAGLVRGPLAGGVSTPCLRCASTAAPPSRASPPAPRPWPSPGSSTPPPPRPRRPRASSATASPAATRPAPPWCSGPGPPRQPARRAGGGPGSGLGKPLQVRWEVARDEDFRHVVARGKVRTSADSDHTVKVDVTGLQPYTRYHYRFESRGERSPVGHTRTAPDVPGEVHALRFALVSCSNYTGGYFTAYRAIAAARRPRPRAARRRLHLRVRQRRRPLRAAGALVGVRDGQPETETIDLEGYRLRHALHKADPDAQAAHRALPWITIFDDHEVANNAWANGAENHQADEGAYLARRAQAMQAYLEWMPFRMPDQSVPHQGTRFFKRFTFGALGDLSILETRQNRSQQVTVPGVPFDGFVPIGVNPAIDGAHRLAARHLPEPEQLTWLKDGVAQQGRPWHLLGNQVMVAPVLYPGAALGAPGPHLRQRRPVGRLRRRPGQPARPPRRAARRGRRRGRAHRRHPRVVLVRDPGRRRPPGRRRTLRPAVEFVCPSVTSDGFFEVLGGTAQLAGQPPEVVVAVTRQAIGAAQQLNPWLRYIDGVSHGFVVIDVTPERVQADYHHTPVPDERGARPAGRPVGRAGLRAQPADARGHPPGDGGIRAGGAAQRPARLSGPAHPPR